MGYRDEREALRRRVEALERQLAEALDDDKDAASQLRRLRDATQTLERERDSLAERLERAEAEQERLRGRHEELRRNQATPRRRRTWLAVLAVLVIGTLLALDVPRVATLLVVFFIALMWALHRDMGREREGSESNEPAETKARRPASKRKQLRARVEQDHRRKHVEVAARQRPRRRVKRRR